MKYRREIDGLRAVAVVPTILFHAGVSLLSGGFVGVDVFFVISGYLITSIIAADLAQGTFSFAKFYERRARRILPALLVVLVATIPAAWWLLVPGDLEQFARSVISVVLFVSNFFFRASTGYFAASSEYAPLLHTWSLAVEEQYYLLFPLLMVAVWRLARARLLAILVVLLVASLGLAEWASEYHPGIAFYTLPTRGWELMVGASLALVPARVSGSHSRWASDVAGAVGLGMILFAMLTYTSLTPFPGFFATVPVIGTALVIRYGTPETVVGRILGAPVLVGIGLVSYSAYLWHQPLLAFARHQTDGELQTGVLIVILAAISGLAWLSWRYVELPFRDPARVDRSTLVRWTLATTALVAAVATVGVVSRGGASRLSPNEQQLAGFRAYDFATTYRRQVCFLPSRSKTGFAPECGGSAQPAVLIWGDSYAAALWSGLQMPAGSTAQYTVAGCPPIGVAELRRLHICNSSNLEVLAAIARLQPRRVVLHGNWRRYENDESIQLVGVTLRRIREVAPTARVTVVGPVPHWPPTLPSRMLKRGVALADGATMLLSEPEAVRALDARLAAIVRAEGGEFLSALDALCDGPRCVVAVSANGAIAPVAWDIGHLTAPGASFVARRLGLTGPPR